MRGDNKPKPTGETYIRNLPYSSVKYLSLLLDVDNNWEKLVVKIPKRLQDVGKAQLTERRYTNLQVRLFEEKSKRPDGSPTKSILDDWSTQNARVKHLIRILQEAALYEAADYISVEIIHEGKVPRLQQSGDNGVEELPVPTWADSKPKTLDEPKDTKLLTNMDDSCGKTLYTREKCLGSFDKDEKTYDKSTYNSLVKSSDGGCDYNKLLPSNDKGFYDKDVNYHRTSFDSWGGVSVPNEGGNDGASKSSGIEYEETYQVRPIRDDTSLKQPLSDDGGVYTYGKGVYQLAKEVPEPYMESISPPPRQPISPQRWEPMSPQRREPISPQRWEPMSPQRREPISPQRREPMSPQRREPISPQRREPCQNDDQSESSTGDEDLYKILGKQNLTYALLERITDNFNPKLVKDGGRIIGMGGFGEVFLGKFENGFQVAIKKLKTMEDGIEKQFETELNSLVKYRHRNIVRLFGFSIDGPGKCLVYEYLCNGSLEDRLMRIGKTPPLPNDIRLSILVGTAEGISDLNGQGIVHRDIKSANVLLDKNFEPKIGDFATARAGPRGNATMAMSTQVVIGTSAYLAPEAINFDVSTKLDAYSFGIIILEVLTSLPPLDHSREEKDIKSYVEERDIEPLLDTSGGKWMDDTVASLVEISEKLTNVRKKQRVNVIDILPDLKALG